MTFTQMPRLGHDLLHTQLFDIGHKNCLSHIQVSVYKSEINKCRMHKSFKALQNKLNFVLETCIDVLIVISHVAFSVKI